MYTNKKQRETGGPGENTGGQTNTGSENHGNGGNTVGGDQGASKEGAVENGQSIMDGKIEGEPLKASGPGEITKEEAAGNLAEELSNGPGPDANLAEQAQPEKTLGQKLISKENKYSDGVIDQIQSKSSDLIDWINDNVTVPDIGDADLRESMENKKKAAIQNIVDAAEKATAVQGYRAD